MELFQILSSCNETLGNCCSDYAVAKLLSIMHRALNIIQLIAPILLILSFCIDLIKLMLNPDDKKGNKPLFNKVIATVICFLMPTIINLVFNIVPGNVEVGACWQAAKNIEAASSSQESYSSTNDQNLTTFFNTDQASGSGNSSRNGSSNGGQTVEGSTLGEQIVNYAKQFVGMPYLWGGKWNGELPYTSTDCYGFVQGVFKHFGISLQRSIKAQWADTSKYTLVDKSEMKAGDIVMYDGHVALATGNGYEIVHAANRNAGVIISKNCFYTQPLGIMRVNELA